MSSNKELEIAKIIEKLVTSGKKTFDDGLMKKLKNICKISNEYVNYTYYALMTQLRKEHSEVRYSTLLIINELFLRSSVFRKLLETELEEFLELVVETDPDNPLPLPRDAAKALKLKGLEFVQVWTSKFGNKCNRLELALTYLKKCRKVDFNDMEARNVAQREQLRQEQERQERMLNEKVNKVRSEMLEMSEGISNTVLQMENCFRLLVPHPVDFFSPEDFAMAEDQNPGNLEKDQTDSREGSDKLNVDVNESLNTDDSLRHHGLYNMKKTITIEVTEGSEISVNVNEDTLPIIENLEDLYKELNTGYFSSVTRWLKILTKGSNCTDSLKKAIDLKRMIESAFEKYKDLKMKNDSTNLGDEDDEDDDFVEVKDKDGYEAEAVTESSLPAIFSQPSCSKASNTVEKPSMWKLKHSEEDIKDPTSAVSTLKKRVLKHKIEDQDFLFKKPDAKKGKKAELLEKAPVLPYDIDLYHWEDKKPVVPEVVQFDSLHKFWESKNEGEENETLKAVQIASLRTRKIDFSGKFEPVKWACRTPLPSGKLCPRKDRYKCPFHGVIIKRDPLGQPVDIPENTPGTSTQTTSAVPEWQDPALLRDIEAATGIDLKIPEKRRKGGKKSGKKEGGLTNINKITNNVRDRLSKKIIKRYKHCAKKMDDMERKRFNDKYGDQWNYY